jgi:hypothetical protein
LENLILAGNLHALHFQKERGRVRTYRTHRLIFFVLLFITFIFYKASQ